MFNSRNLLLLLKTRSHYFLDQRAESQSERRERKIVSVLKIKSIKHVSAFFQKTVPNFSGETARQDALCAQRVFGFCIVY